MSGGFMWGKFAVYSTIIIGVGYTAMKLATPTEQQFYDALAPDLKRKVDEIRAQREGSTAVRDKLATAGAQDQVVWAEQLGSTKPPGGGRRV
ncbi:hypothetical protein JCM24511_02850 [Saitozyma sp. JCM 24511]|uniref:Cytochrome b mRNA-processing protein 4 n=1 Tax=Saitozyma podzolica TaxID=1890683 RepID=A0A427YIY7_9TREE|nr:hypothetical protein EHS25_010240 [Saitozyma podzolica]GFZ45124.1 hypothetical protein JCM24511_02850 [Saitozyma sp. JCM 24511]